VFLLLDVTDGVQFADAIGIAACGPVAMRSEGPPNCFVLRT
jgi:hypothetical protein